MIAMVSKECMAADRAFLLDKILCNRRAGTDLALQNSDSHISSKPYVVRTLWSGANQNSRPAGLEGKM
ncbi:unnamed protein product [Linum trigynum]|uniref:Uncharacterized protein n=1 Tax=Linum trigynum TaxID=586398 RepID=A0AAV2FGK5_9ROSI